MLDPIKFHDTNCVFCKEDVLRCMVYRRVMAYPHHPVAAVYPSDKIVNGKCLNFKKESK